MTRQFNLLPARYVERIAERRKVRMTAAALMLLVALLVLVAFGHDRQLSRAARSRDVEQARNAELQGRRQKLLPFRQLADGIVGRERLLTAAMETEVSWARVLASLAQRFPDDASLTSLTAESTLPAFSAVPRVAPGDESSVIGTFALTGYSVTKFTPGVERLLQLLATVTGLTEPRLQEGIAEKIGTIPVTTFEGTTFVDGTAMTGRYAAGLPPEDNVEVPPIGRGAVPAPPSRTPPQAVR